VNVILGLALLIPFLIPTTGTEGVPTILQQVRIGDLPLIPNTGMTPPIALVHPQPMYTAEAVRAGVAETVTIRAEFDIEGNFQVLEVVDSPGFGLEEAALAALENWRFRPAYRSGRRVAVIANVEIEFRNTVSFDRFQVVFPSGGASPATQQFDRFEVGLPR
jgi:TonB family protein